MYSIFRYAERNCAGWCTLEDSIVTARDSGEMGKQDLNDEGLTCARTAIRIERDLPAPTVEVIRDLVIDQTLLSRNAVDSVL